MPTYEYVCKSCGEKLEVFQSFHDDPLKVCPQCGGELRKVFGSIAISFKGSGFYKTDSRSSASSTVSSTSKDADSPTSTAPVTAPASDAASPKTEASPATKTTSPSPGSSDAA